MVRQSFWSRCCELLVTSFCVVNISATTIQEAQQAYSMGKFKEAADAYSEVLASVSPNATLYYNLALAQKSAGEPGKAALALRRALMLDPRMSDARIVLSDLERSQGISFVEQDWREWLIERVPLFPALVAIFITLGAAIGLLLFQKNTMMRIWGGAVVLGCIAFFLTLVLAEPRFAWRHNAIVIRNATLTKIPAEHSEIVTKLPSGTMLTPREKGHGAWVFCRLVDGREGWIAASSIAYLLP